MMEIEGSEMTQDQKEDAMRRSLEALSRIDLTLPPVGVSLILHDVLRGHGVAEDPYVELKKASTRAALSMILDLERKLEVSEDRFALAAMMAIAGNVIDYGAANQLSLEDTLEDAINNGLGIDDLNVLREELQSASTISYYLDNSGEVVLDGILMREMIRIRPDLRIRAYAKKVPLLNDVTLKDALEAGLGEIPGVEVHELPEAGWADPDIVKALGGDIIIAKGQGNYESLSSMRGLFFLMVVKCSVVSDELGVPIGEMVFKKT